jgi:4'-phosphopantetheinyl transferase
LPTPQLWLVPWDPPEHAGVCSDTWSEHAALASALSASEQHWADRLPAPQRWRYAMSRAAMRHLLSGVLDVAALQVPLHSPPGKPPQLAPQQGFVSLSHARGAALIAWSPAAIGVDVEAADRSFDARALLQRFFPLQEQRQLQALPAEPLRQAVLRSWIAKEAAIKWRQRSLAQELTAWSFEHASGLLHHCSEALTLKPCEGLCQRWRWAAAGESLESLQVAPLIWRFES